MNNIFAWRLSSLMSLAMIAVVGSGLSAEAQTIDTGSINAAPQTPIEQQQPKQTTSIEEPATSTSAPVPGTTATSAAPLTTELPVTPQLAPASETVAPTVAQTDIDPGQTTRGGSSYVGIAGNFGVAGESELGSTNFAVISKIGFTDTISARPSVIVTGDPVFLIPVTYDLALLPFAEQLPLSPYLGAGLAISTGDGSDVGPMLTAGLDFPLTTQFTATAAVNVGFLEEVDVGVVVGVGYNFTGFGF